MKYRSMDIIILKKDDLELVELISRMGSTIITPWEERQNQRFRDRIKMIQDKQHQEEVHLRQYKIQTETIQLALHVVTMQMD